MMINMWPFKCKHKEFKMLREGERVCTKCGQEQWLVYVRIGPIRWKWVDKGKPASFSTDDFNQRWVKGKKRY